jgi:aminomethyltransferase
VNSTSDGSTDPPRFAVDDAESGSYIPCPVGEITSGTFSPTLEKSIAMGYAPGKLSSAGTALSVGVSHEVVPATVVGIPFYSRRT